MVLVGAAIAQFQATAAAAGDLGDDAFHVGPVHAVLLPQVGLVGPVAASPAEQVVTLVQADRAAGLGCGAARGERAVAAECAEDHVTGLGDGTGVADRAGHGGGGFVDGEVVHGESTRDRSRDRPGLDHRVVSGVVDRATQIPCAVSAIAVPLRRARLTVVGAAVGGDELLRHRRIGVLRAGGLGERLVGDDPRLRLGHHMRPKPVATCLRCCPALKMTMTASLSVRTNSWRWCAS